MSGSIRDRRNWTRSLTVVIVVAAAAVVISNMVGANSDKVNRLYLKNSAGAVLFDHEKHSQSAESCAQCHHDLYGAEQITTCAECHDEGVVASEFNHVELKEIHSRECSTCHEQTGEEDQAVSCRTCHPGMQEADNNTVGCIECHDETYLPEMMSHDEYTEMEEHTCLGCHTPKSVSEVFHLDCSQCHQETVPQRFSQADGAVQCGSCHLR